MSDEKITRLRKKRSVQVLDQSSVDLDPINQFGRWYREVIDSRLSEPNAMVLATVGHDGRPSARVVLMKEYNEQGFVFFTNYGSRKGSDLRNESSASLLFYWAELERQVRIEGRVTKVSRKESEEYFRTRPTESRLSAWASRQSSVIRDRRELERRVEEFRVRYGGGEIPLPPDWGGYRLRPVMFEFWQGRPNRLHDRIRYRRKGRNWLIERLAP
jgi:pyridoxamine 5'-phosphate oxidase